ncbi:hypothetical protein Hypma_004264 [Hypsizygus marmoreus]|uniref:Uncharacterized protein n=1 Tax=Hypsizygus marmoreus TaxID=39966 RepID=A0A369J9K6_HYPMA|nr:hypothetical protein Hypma_004264 [Hypsizygus marmoreus]
MPVMHARPRPASLPPSPLVLLHSFSWLSTGRCASRAPLKSMAKHPTFTGQFLPGSEDQSLNLISKKPFPQSASYFIQV